MGIMHHVITHKWRIYTLARRLQPRMSGWHIVRHHRQPGCNSNYQWKAWMVLFEGLLIFTYVYNKAIQE